MAVFVIRPSGACRASGSVSAQTIAGDSAYHPIATIHADDRYGGRCMINIIVGGTGPLTGLKLTASPVKNGTNAVARLVDADFNSSSSGILPFTTGGASSLYQLATGGVGQIVLNFDAPGEYVLYAKSANSTTVALEIAG
jgi:hypothetical protein